MLNENIRLSGATTGFDIAAVTPVAPKSGFYNCTRPTKFPVFVSPVKRASLLSWGFVFFVVQVFLMAAAPPIFAQDNSKIPLIVMGDTDYPPYESLVDGEPVGINVDLWREIAKILGRPLDLRLNQWAESQVKVQRGEGKVLTFMSINKERAELYDFTPPTFTSRLGFTPIPRTVELSSISVV